MNASPKLRHILMTGALAMTTWLGTSFAQSTQTPALEAPPTTAENDTMDHYLTNHPRVADELHNNPSLINNPQWLAQHPEVQNWMNTHPNVKADAVTNPKSIVNQTERQTLNTDRRALNNTDNFLSQHPGMAKQLNANPNLVDDPKYLAAHPALQSYLKDHPAIASEWKNHPEAFADAARADERYNKTGRVPPVAHTKPVAKK